MVDIYLNYGEPPKAPFLSVPNSDIERLSNRPLRWLRYVMFSICGARGDLFRTLDPTDDPVDYNTSLADLPAAIYYKSSGKISCCMRSLLHTVPLPLFLQKAAASWTMNA